MGCGRTDDWKKIDFITDEDVEELNSIGYSGSDTKGNKTTWVNYLEEKYQDKSFLMVKTRRDNGDFSEDFVISIYG
jgi:hypothetical protein